jgi:hypothetical protein
MSTPADTPAELVRRLREDFEDALGYVPEYFRGKWEYDATLAATAELAAEVERMGAVVDAARLVSEGQVRHPRERWRKCPNWSHAFDVCLCLHVELQAALAALRDGRKDPNVR